LIRLIAAPACVLLLLLPWQVVAQDARPATASLLPHWIPQAQFAGYMMAAEKEFYREAGVDLRLLRGGPESPPMEALKAGRTTFCTAWLSTGLQQRATGVPVVNLAQIVQRSGLMLVAKKAGGISTPESLEGKRVGLWEGDFRIQPAAFFSRNGLAPRIVPLYSTANLFLKGAVDAVSVMWYNEYHAILNCGLNPDELTIFFLSDYGLNFPEDGIYCLEETFRRDPDLCARVVAASLKGWIYAADHEEETVNVVIRHAREAHTGTNAAQQRWMLARMKDLIFPSGSRAGLGKLVAEDFRRVAETLRELNLIDAVPRFEDFHRGAQ
jgi:NitT/TauT family transport system substrate-binding protein